MEKLVYILILVMVLSACAPLSDPFTETMPPEKLATPLPSLTAPAPQPETPGETVTGQEATVDEATAREDPLFLMLYSHTRWGRLRIDAVKVDYAGDDANTPVQSTRTQLWIEQPDQARILSGPLDGSPDRLWVSDGKNWQENGGEVGHLPDLSNIEFIPPIPPTDTIYPHPLGSSMGSTLNDYIFSTVLVQRGGEYRLVGVENFAGREALLLEYYRPPSEAVIDRMWVDAATGVVLRAINFGKPGGGQINSEYYVTAIQFEPEFPEGTFTLGGELPANFEDF